MNKGESSTYPCGTPKLSGRVRDNKMLILMDDEREDI